MAQFNVVKVIYISKVAGVEVRPQCGACLVEICCHLLGTAKQTQCRQIDIMYIYIM